MEKNVSIIDETGRLIGTTYPKRAKGLVKSGRARYVSCDMKDTICLTCPPNKMEDNTMTDNSLLDATNTVAEDQTSDKAVQGSCTPSAEYALRMLESIALDTEVIKNAVSKASPETDNGLAEMIGAHEKTNRELIAFYTQMYNEFKPAAPARKSNTVTRFEEIATMLKGLKKEDYDESAWETLMDSVEMQLSSNY